MSEYIFYTTEGFTQAPNGNNVENCQVLGRAFGKNIKEARCNLIKENPWIEEVGFDMEDLLVEQLLTEEQKARKIKQLLSVFDLQNPHVHKILKSRILKLNIKNKKLIKRDSCPDKR